MQNFLFRETYTLFYSLHSDKKNKTTEKVFHKLVMGWTKVQVVRHSPRMLLRVVSPFHQPNQIAVFAVSRRLHSWRGWDEDDNFVIKIQHGHWDPSTERERRER